MNYLVKLFYTLLIIFFTASCKKSVDIDSETYTANFKVINAVPDFNTVVKANFTGADHVYLNDINVGFFYSDGKYNNGALDYSVPVNIKLPVQIVINNDTSKPVYEETLSFKKFDNYTLYMAGVPDAIETMLVNETIPLQTDSSTGIRFVHLSPDAGAVSVNLEGMPDGSEFINLDYKDITAFKSYEAKAGSSNYIFEVRDKATGLLLTTFNYDNTARFRNITLLIRGLINGDPGFSVVRINN